MPQERETPGKYVAVMNKLAPQDNREALKLITTSFFVAVQSLGTALAEGTVSSHPNIAGELTHKTVGVTLRTGLLRSLSRSDSLPDIRDLVKLIADSLRLSIQNIAVEIDDEAEQDAVSMLAPSAAAWWKSLFRPNSQVDESHDSPPPSLFSPMNEDAETEHILTPIQWRKILSEAVGAKQIVIGDTSLDTVAGRLDDEFLTVLPQLLSKDSAKGEKTFPDLRPMLLSEILRALQNTPQRAPLPTGTVTFLFTDLEGSTRLWEQHPQIMRASLMRHDAIMRAAIETHHGHVFKQAGDAFYAVFANATSAVASALDAQIRINSEQWDENVPMKVRIGIHTGEAQFRDNDYFGPTLNRVARIMSIGYGNQVLLSRTTASLASSELPQASALKDMGMHRLKDIQHPEQVYQLYHPAIRDDFPPLRSQNAVSSNLPVQLTTFVGRSQDIAEVKALLKTTRLLSLTGGGGAGKTRLSQQVASELLKEESINVWVVELENVREVAAVPSALALALNLPIRPGSDLKQQIIDYLRPLKVLLVLDNFEQVVEAAPIVNDLLRQCPELICLVTSRELLRIAGETEYQVRPLSVPPSEGKVEDWSAFESIQLFIERCQSYRPDFVLTETSGPFVAELCRRLDGIPLAIELAAARIRAMSPQQILQRLSGRLDLLASTQRDLPERQRTLRGAIDWSYDLLTEAERAVFSELAVFSGGFFLEAAEEICLSPETFDSVFSLRDKSLLKADEVDGETRYSTLESVRDYAIEKLRAVNELETFKERHASYYLKKATEWNDKLNGVQAAEAMISFPLDISNLRSAMDWFTHQESFEKIISFGKSLFTFLRRRGLYEEGDIRLQTAQNAARKIGDRSSEARFLNQRGLLSWDRSELDTAQALFTVSYEISQALDDKVRMLVTGINMGNIFWGRTDFRAAKQQWEECLALAVTTDQPRYEGMLRTSLGILACSLGHYSEAHLYFDAAKVIQRGIGNTEGVAYVLCSASELFRREGSFDKAIVRLEESLEIFRSLGHRQGIAETVVELGRNNLSLGKLETAEEYLERGLQIAREIDDRRQQMYALEIQAQLDGLRGRFSAASERFESAFRIAHEVGDRRQMIETLHHYSDLLWDNDDQERSYLLVSVAEEECQKLGLVEANDLRNKRLDRSLNLGSASERLDDEAAGLSLGELSNLLIPTLSLCS